MNNVIPITSKHAALEMLPKSHRTHWVARRKAQVVQAVQRGWLSLEEACSRYRLSEDEFLEWERALALEGLDGLKLTRANRRSATAVMPPLPEARRFAGNALR